MKIPETGKRKALIVVDVQPAFIRPRNLYVLKNIATLINKVPYDAYVEALFYVDKNSLWYEQQKWAAPRGNQTHTMPEVADALSAHKPLRVFKDTRSAFRGERDVEKFLKKHKISEVHVVGTETNDCVFATAIDAFDCGFLPYVLEECCEAATKRRHELGVKLLREQQMTNNSCLAKTFSIQL